MTNNNTQHLSKILITTLSILFLTGLSAAASPTVSSLSVTDSSNTVTTLDGTTFLQDGNDNIVTAEISDTDNDISGVTLYYATDADGSTTASSTDTAVTMVDDGSGNDATGGDGTYTATIPDSAVSTNGNYVNFVIETSDSSSSGTNKFPSSGDNEYRIDGSAPVSPSNPSATSQSSGDIQVSWDSVTDGESGLNQYIVYRAATSGGSYSQIGTVSSGTTSYTDSSSLTDGEDYFYKVSAEDNVGNEGSKSVEKSATSDSTSPALGSASKNTDTEFTFQVTDSATGLDVSTIDSSDFQIQDSGISAQSFSIGSGAEGASSVTVTANLGSAVDKDTLTVEMTGSVSDLAGNSQSSDTVSISGMDGVSPQLSSATKVDFQTIDVTITDGVDVNETTITASDFSLSSGSIDTITTSESDTDSVVTLNLANKVDSENIDVSIATGETVSDTSSNTLTDSASPVTANNMDGVAPSVSNKNLVDQTDGNGAVKDADTVRVYASITDGTGISSVTADLSNFGASGTATLYPETDGTNGKDWNGDGDSADSSVYGADVTVDSASATEGTGKTATITATDSSNGANSVTTSSFGSLTNDFSAPSVSEVVLTDNTDSNGVVTNGDEVLVTATVTDTGSGIDTVNVDLSSFNAGSSVSLSDSGPNSSSGDDQYSATVQVGSSPTEGTQSVTVSSTDLAGNGGSQSVGSGTLEVDTTQPTVSGTSLNVTTPVSDSETGTVEVTVNFGEDMDQTVAPTVDITGLTSSYNSISGSYTNSNTWVGTVDLKDEEDEDATATITVTGAEDVASNTIDTNSNTGTFSVDTSNPSVSTSISGYLTGKTVNLESYFSPSSGDEETTTYERNTSSGWTTISSSSSWDSTTASDGFYQFRATTTDDAGNTDTATGTATVDNTKPSIQKQASISLSGDSNSNGILNKGESFVVSVNTSDATSGVSGTTVDLSSIGMGSGNSLTQYKSTDVYNKTFALSSSNGYESSDFTPQVSINDVAGNTQTSTPSTGISVDTIVPTVTNANTGITLTTDNNGSNRANPGDVVEVTWDSSEATDTVSKVEVDFSNFGGSTVTATDPNTDGTYNASYKVQSGSIDSSVTASVKVTDDADNINSADTNTQSVDNKVPSEPQSFSATAKAGGDIEVTWNAPSTDSSDGLTYSLEYRKDSGSWQSLTSSGTSKTHSGLTDGSNYSYRVTANDDAGNTGPVSSTASAVADSSAPTVSSIEVIDRDRDGNVDAANVTFSEAVKDTSLTASNWEIGSTTVDSKNTGSTADDSKIQLRLTLDSNEISGTAVQDVTTESTPSVTDLAGNTFTDIATGDVTESDEADPVVHYSSGSNMVSFPSKVGLYSLDTLLSNSGNVDAVWRYSNGEWESYKPSRSSSNNDFNKVEGGHGYILKASGSGKIVADVDQGDKDQKSPSGVSIKKDRWNLVGHYEETTEGTLSNIGLSTNIDQIVERDGSGSFTSVAEVNPGEGYWVSAAADKLYEPVFN